ncbi:Inner membrane protein ytfF [Raoultella planticola]|uniref:Inner membrane protein ytfF n=1 Tax=Raoultella planticola TaxID=575 RepID=A0A485AQD1_RAOPL|nr:Inner membrane protein ytfF [Raoultella planticola]
MISGVLYALLAGMMWGLIFVGPVLVPEYPAVLQSMGRYLALGLIALPLAWLGRARLRQLSGRDWWTALGLTMMGNLIYYVCLASAIQRTGAPVSTMIIGTLPVVLPVMANLLYSQRDGKLPWRRLFPALSCIAVGLVCVNIAELRQGLPNFSIWRYGSGIGLALISVACWAWYALRNARWLRENPDKHPMMWATAQALVTLPVSLARLSDCLRMAACPAGRLPAALWPTSPDLRDADAGHRGPLLLGRRIVLEYRQPEAANGHSRAAHRLRNAGGPAVYLPVTTKHAAAADAQRHPATGCWRGLRGLFATTKTGGCGAGLRE